MLIIPNDSLNRSLSLKQVKGLEQEKGSEF